MKRISMQTIDALQHNTVHKIQLRKKEKENEQTEDTKSRFETHSDK